MLKSLDSQVQLLANLTIVARDDRTGKVVARRKVKNLVVSTGRGLVAGLLAGTTTFPTHLAVGDGNTAAALADTALENEVDRVQITGRNVVANVLTVYTYLPSTRGNGFTLREAGLFNASSGGTLFARVTYSSIAKNSSTSVTFTWQFTITSS